MIRPETIEEESFMCLDLLNTEELLEEMKSKLTMNTYIIYKRALQCIDVRMNQYEHAAYLRFIRDKIIYHAHKNVKV